MVSLFFFSVSLLCSALSIKVEALTELKATAVPADFPPPEYHCKVETELVVSPPEIAAEVELESDSRALLDPSETRFFRKLRAAVEPLGCRVLAKVHLPSLTKHADEPAVPAHLLNRALAALNCWEADFAICRGDSLNVLAVIRVRSGDEGSRGSEHPNVEVALHETLAAASIPVVLLAEPDRYDQAQIAALINEHLAS